MARQANHIMIWVIVLPRSCVIETHRVTAAGTVTPSRELTIRPLTTSDLGMLGARRIKLGRLAQWWELLSMFTGTPTITVVCGKLHTGLLHILSDDLFPTSWMVAPSANAEKLLKDALPDLHPEAAETVSKDGVLIGASRSTVAADTFGACSSTCRA